jgi:hypothetical protein
VNIKYGEIDDLPVRYTDKEAWWFVKGAWEKIDPATAHEKAAIVGEASFNKLYPDLPPLPITAFQSSDKPS